MLSTHGRHNRVRNATHATVHSSSIYYARKERRAMSFYLPQDDNNPAPAMVGNCEVCGAHDALSPDAYRRYTCQVCQRLAAHADWICQRCGHAVAFLSATRAGEWVCSPCVAAIASGSIPLEPPKKEPAPELPKVQWHAGLANDGLAGCQPEPVPGVSYCAAAYLAALDASGFSFVPQGVATLCETHWKAAPSNEAGRAIMFAAQGIAARISARNSR